MKEIADLDSNNENSSVAEVIQILNSIDENSSDAKLNATSMSDGKGGRILF